MFIHHSLYQEYNQIVGKAKPHCTVVSHILFQPITDRCNQISGRYSLQGIGIVLVNN